MVWLDGATYLMAFAIVLSLVPRGRAVAADEESTGVFAGLKYVANDRLLGPASLTILLFGLLAPPQWMREGCVRKRLDVLLVERGLADSRAQAQALVMAGRVAGFEKAGQQIDETVELELTETPRFVSRGGEKLDHALDVFGVDPAGRKCLDVGASTGGFADVLLQRAAAQVIALDVGRGQLHERLRDDPRVIVLENVNARYLTELPFAPELITCDVSFISLRQVLPAVLRLGAPGWEAVVLVKPQFEAGRTEAKGGVVRSPDVHRTVLRQIADAVLGWDAAVAGVTDSGLPGPKGNREFFLHLVHRPKPEPPAELDRWIADAVG